MSYAKGTKVSADRSRSEIERMLAKNKATRFVSGWDADKATIAFEKNNRRVRFEVSLPLIKDFMTSPKGQRRALGAAEHACLDETRRRWRSLTLVIKAKLEAVDSGVSTFDDEFLAFIVLADGSTVGEVLGPQIEAAYANHKMPALLPAKLR